MEYETQEQSAPSPMSGSGPPSPCGYIPPSPEGSFSSMLPHMPVFPNTTIQESPPSERGVSDPIPFLPESDDVPSPLDETNDFQSIVPPQEEPQGGEADTLEQAGVLEEERPLDSESLTQRDLGDRFPEPARTQKLIATGYSYGMWTSVWLRPRTIMAFAAIFLALLLATAIIFHVAKANNGLATQQEHNHYAWTYGPTAVLTILLSLWNQLDYTVRTLTPWQGLTENAPADQTLLLDYITPFWGVNLWKAMKRRHWAVVVTTSGVLLIKLTTVFSTGFLLLQSTTVVKSDMPFTTLNSFDGPDPNSDLFDVAFNTETSNGDGLTKNSNSSLYYYAVKRLGLRLPPGVSDDIVVVDFAPQDGGQLAAGFEHTAIVPGVQPQIDCLPVTGLSIPPIDLNLSSGWIWLNISTPYCNLTHFDFASNSLWPDVVFWDPDLNTTAANIIAKKPVYFANYDCDTGFETAGKIITYLGNGTVFPPSNKRRLIMAVAKLHLVGPLVYFDDMTIAICESSYTMSEHRVTFMAGSDNHTKLMKTQKVSDKLSSGIPGFPSDRLGLAVEKSVDDAAQIIGSRNEYNLGGEGKNFFEIILDTNEGLTFEALLDPEVLIDTGVKAFKGIASMVLYSSSLAPATNTVTGSLTYPEDRLQARPLSTGFMIGFLGVLFTLCGLLLLVLPRITVPSEPGSIGFIAAILASSPELRSRLDFLGSVRTSRIRERLSGLQFRSQVVNDPVPSFAIECVNGTPDHEQPQGVTEKDEGHFWQPFPVRWWFQGLAFLLPLAAIIGLEVIQRQSDLHQGFMEIKNSRNTLMLAAYIPATMAFGITSLFSSIRLTTCILAPWVALREGNAKASRSLSLDLVNRLPPHRLWLALKSRNFSVFFLCVANVLAAWVPVLVSGLYDTMTAPTAFGSLDLAQKDVFDYGNQKDLNDHDGQASTVAYMAKFYNASFPQWTYNNLVLNKIDLTDGSQPDWLRNETSTRITAPVLATRPSLNCTILPDNSTILYLLDASKGPGAQAAARSNLSSLCEKPLPPGADLTMEWHFHFELKSSEILVGQVLTAVDTEYWGLNESYGCPVFGVAIGKGSPKINYHEELYFLPRRESCSTEPHAECINVDPSNPPTLTQYGLDVAVVVCRQHIQTVNTSITLSLPALDLLADVPPVVDESTAQYVLNSLADGDQGRTFEMGLQSMIDYASTPSYISPYNTSQSGDNNSTSENFYSTGNGAFMQALRLLVPSQTFAALAGVANAPQLISAVSSLYGTYMAQAVNANFRSSDLQAPVVSTPHAAKTQAPQLTWEARVQSSVPRLRQQAGAKTALQVVLAVMLGCLAAGEALMWGMGRVVPHNPTTIAGAGSLLADGDVTTRRVVPAGAEWRAGGTGRSPFDGRLFRLGWWEGPGGRRRYGVNAGSTEAYKSST